MLWSLRRVLGLRFSVVLIAGLVVMLVLKAPRAVAPSAVAPARAIASMSSAQDDITGSIARRPAANGLVVHVVARNDTLSGIARRYGLSVADIARLNGIDRNALVKSGDILVIPPG
jgi:LysM repeat protein